MPTYQANEYLDHEGKVVQIGDFVELSEKQASSLKDKVTLVKVEDLKEKAKEKGIEGASKMKKDELLQAVKEE